jgi:hypothetical protein
MLIIQHCMQAIPILKPKHLIVRLNTLFSLYGEHRFLGVQRGHQNTLENYPQFLLMLGLGSIQYPLISSIGGAVWLIGRIAYFHV